MLFSIFVGVIAFSAALLSGEFYFRQKESYAVSLQAEHAKRKSILDRGPEDLVIFRKGGKRLVKDARSMIYNHRLSRRNIIISTNSMGFRDDEVPPSKNGEFRALFLGDSITLGDYLQADEVYLEVAERKLIEGTGDEQIRLVNAGVKDIGIEEEVKILEESGLSIKPDLVVVAFYLNDSRPPRGFAEELGGYGWLRNNSILARVIYRELALRKWMSERGIERFDWIKQAAPLKIDWKADRKQFLELAKMASYDWGAAWRDDSWEVIRRELERIKAHQESGFEVAVISFPVYYQVYADYLEDGPQRRLEKICSELGFKYLDLLPLLREYNDRPLFYDHCHPNLEANKIIGQEVARFLKPIVAKTGEDDVRSGKAPP